MANEPTLFGIPAELRNIIYYFALFDTAEPKRFCDHLVDRSGVHEPALLLNCKQIRKEAAPIFYHMHHFEITLDDLEEDMLERWMEKTLSVVTEFKIYSFATYYFEDIVRDWDKWLEWMRLNHADGYAFAVRGIFFGDDVDPVDSATLQAMLCVVRKMSESPWKDVKEVLEMHRQILSCAYEEWDEDWGE